MAKNLPGWERLRCSLWGIGNHKNAIFFLNFFLKNSEQADEQTRRFP